MDGFLENEESEYWTQVIYKVKSKFRNPIKQNWSHVYILKKILKHTNNIKYHPIVVFSGNAELKNIQSNVTVTYVELLYQIICDKSTMEYLTKDEVKSIYEKLLNYSIDNNKANKIEHKRQILTRIEERIEIENKMECPKCGKLLVLRKGRFGPFWHVQIIPTVTLQKHINNAVTESTLNAFAIVAQATRNDRVGETQNKTSPNNLHARRPMYWLF